MPEPAFVFIGFMGAGKSTALAAARDAGIETIEVDELLERDLGMTIADAFERLGEEAFRSREAEVVGELLERAEGGAIALGGGSVLSARVQEALARHVVVWLQIDAETAWRRIEGSGRPLAKSADDVARLLAQRLPIYEALADAFVMAGDPGTVARALPSIGALSSLPGGTRLLWASSDSGEYPVLVGKGLLDADWWPLEGRRFCVTDTTVGPLYGDRIQPLSGRVEVEPGERAKTLAEAESVLRELASAGMTRADHVVALGGGVVGDLAGFCAHTYQRGVAVVQVPTTLAAQVDSAYGGKTGVDLPEAKNYVGAYHQPAAVIVDPGTLETLPAVELGAGFAELVKTALLAGGALWGAVREIAEAPAEWSDLVLACARFKCEIVAADERDDGQRQALNLGHTVAHAIETATGYGRYRHGEAVSLGLLVALRLSEASDLREEVRAVLERHRLPVRLDRDIDLDAVMVAIERDKKQTADGVGFVLLPAPGKPRVGQLVDANSVRQAVEELIP